jgi:hypothetical protein
MTGECEPRGIPAPFAGGRLEPTTLCTHPLGTPLPIYGYARSLRSLRGYSDKPAKEAHLHSGGRALSLKHDRLWEPGDGSVGLGNGLRK